MKYHRAHADLDAQRDLTHDTHKAKGVSKSGNGMWGLCLNWTFAKKSRGKGIPDRGRAKCVEVTVGSLAAGEWVSDGSNGMEAVTRGGT